MRGQACSLAADGILDHLHDDFLAIAQQLIDRGCCLRRRLGVFTQQDGLRPDDIRGMQESRPIKPDFDERGLHARHDPADLALVHIADIAATAGTFDMHLLQHAVLDQRNAGFARGHVDQDFFGHDKMLARKVEVIYSWRRRMLSNAKYTSFIFMQGLWIAFDSQNCSKSPEQL